MGKTQTREFGCQISSVWNEENWFARWKEQQYQIYLWRDCSLHTFSLQHLVPFYSKLVRQCQLALVEALQLVLEHPLAEECKAGGNCDFSMWLISNKSRRETDALSPEKNKIATKIKCVSRTRLRKSQSFDLFLQLLFQVGKSFMDHFLWCDGCMGWWHQRLLVTVLCRQWFSHELLHFCGQWRWPQWWNKWLWP